MGAYSSFAMLALTHHVIVRYSCIKANFPVDKLIYAVLGDDGAMANEQVARVYKQTFSTLGMDINPIKGFDGNVLEFAKQLWTINGYNISPLGAKNILLAIRHVEFLPSVLYELFVKMFPIYIRSNVGRTFTKAFKGASWGYFNKRNWKRGSGASYIYLFSFDSLIKLISSLFFVKKDKNGKVIYDENGYVKIAIRVLMAIGPRSGLWYLDHMTTSYLYGRHTDLFMNMFLDYIQKIFHPVVSLASLSEEDQLSLKSGNPALVHRNLILYKIREINNSRIVIFKNLWRSLCELGKLLVIYIQIPVTFVPDHNRHNSGLPSIVNTIYSFITIGVPVQINLLHQFIGQLKKVILRAYLLGRFNLLSWLKHQTFVKVQSTLIICMVLLYFATGSFLLVIALFLSWSLLWIPRVQFTIQIWLFQTVGFDFPSLRDTLQFPPYEPFSNSISTLQKVSDKVKLEDSGAYLEVLRICGNSSKMKAYLKRVKMGQKGKFSHSLSRPLTKGPSHAK